MLVSSASTTNTREIKNRFFFSVGAGAYRRAPQKLSIQNKRVDFFGFSHVFYDILFTIFCLLSLLGFCFLISIRKSTNTYIQYINVSICFHCFVGFMYAIFFLFSFCFVYYNILLSGGVCHAQSAPTTTALYKFWDMDFTCATHTNCLKFIAGSRLLDRFLLSFLHIYLYWFN